MNVFSTYLFYFFIVILVSWFASKSQNVRYINGNDYVVNIRKLYIVASFLVAWLVAGLRYDVGADYFSYIRMYNEIGQNGLYWALSTFRAEPLYVILNWVIYHITGQPELVFIITSFFVLILIYFIVFQKKESLNVGLALFVFMTLYYFPNFTFIRLSIAVAIVFYSYKYLENRNFKRYTLCILTAVGFHYTAIIMLPIFFLVNKQDKYKWYKYLMLIMLTLTVLVAFQWVAEIVLSGTKYVIYIEEMGNFQGGINQIILHIPLILIVWFFKERLIKRKLENRIYLQMFFIGSLFLLFTLWIGIIDRMLIYLFISQVLIVPQIINLLKKHEKPLFVTSIVLYYVIRLFYYLYSNPRMFPYETIFS